MYQESDLIALPPHNSRILIKDINTCFSPKPGKENEVNKLTLTMDGRWKETGIAIRDCFNKYNGKGLKGGEEVPCTMIDGSNLPEYTFTETGCSVQEFALKQKVSDASEAIMFWGDPYFLVYWQQFPESEDSWTANLGDTFVTAVLIGTTADLLLTGAGGVVTKAGKAVIGKIDEVKAALTDKTDEIFDIVDDKIDDVSGGKIKGVEMVVGAENKEALKETVQTKLTDKIWLGKVTGQSHIEDFIKLSDNDKIKSILSLLPIKKLTRDHYIFMKKMITKHPKLATAGGAALWIANWYDSRDAKYRFQSNSFVLKLGTEDIENMYRIEPRKASEELKENTVVLAKNKLYDTELYFASPCEANLEIYKDIAYCDGFQKQSDGSVICKGPDGFPPVFQECLKSTNCTDTDGCYAGWEKNVCKIPAIYVKISNPKENTFCYTAQTPTVLNLVASFAVKSVIGLATAKICIATVGIGCVPAAAIAGSLTSTIAWVKLENPWPDHSPLMFP